MEMKDARFPRLEREPLLEEELPVANPPVRLVKGARIRFAPGQPTGLHRHPVSTCGVVTFLSNTLSFRLALRSERVPLEALQMRASLNNPGDREALLANPDAVALPDQQIEAGRVVVAELDGRIVGFASVLPRADGDS